MNLHRSRRIALVATALVAVFHLTSRLGAAQQDDSLIWDRVVMSQPMDKGPFRQIKPPSWVWETIGCGYTLSVMDGQARQRAVKHGVTISEMGFVDPFYAYYDSKLLLRRSPHVPLGAIAAQVAEYKRLGVRILAVYPPTLQAEVYEAQPTWRRIAVNTTEIPQVDLQAAPHGGMLCLLGPYGDFAIDVLAEILEQFPEVDAFSFDGLHHGGVCYCQHCRANYRRDAAAEIPDANMDDPAFRRYQHWADRQLEDVIRRMQERLKGIKPEVALVTWTTNAGRFGHFLSIPRNMPARMNLLLDAPDQEFWLDESNRGATIVPAFANAYLWAVTNHRVGFSEPYILTHGNPYGKDSFPPQEILRRMLLVVTYGAAPSIAVLQPENLQQELYDCMDAIQQRKPWLTDKQPEKWGALLMSDNTRNFYGRSAGLVEERYLANVFGAFRAAVEEHLPITVINDWNLNSDDLAGYRLLLLPNAACLDEQQIAAVRGFVEQGGGLVASLDASLFDEHGDPREDFALSDVLGVRFQGTAQAATVDGELDVNFAKAIGPDYWEKRKNIFDFRQDAASFLNQGRMRTYVGGNAVVFKGPAVRVAANSDAQAFATIADRAVPGAAPIPAVVANHFGNGRSVYLAASLDSAYYLYPYPYHRLVMRQAMLWAASQPPPIQVEAPMCVHSTIMRQQRDGAQRLIVHLYSDLNTTAFHALPNDDVPLREEVVPIADITVAFSASYALGRIRLEPQGLDLTPVLADQGWTVTVPRLDIHAMVVAELVE